MAELPEIMRLAAQMRNELCSKVIRDIDLLQEKCSNVSGDELKRRTTGARIVNVTHKGKWVLTFLDNGDTILLSLGMGGDVIFFTDEAQLPPKFQVKVTFADATGYTIRFWWFGKFLLASHAELEKEPNTAAIGLDPLDKAFSFDYFNSLLAGRKIQIKTFLMDQKNIGGIGNMYMHDILFKGGIHPQRKISDMSGSDISRLYHAMIDVLTFSVQKGAFAMETDFYGGKGNYTPADFLVGYRENQPCPNCQEKIVLIKTGSTGSYICPKCQK